MCTFQEEKGRIGHNRREHGAYKGKKTQNFRDTRTFAEVTCPRPKHQPQIQDPPPSPPLITISPDTETSHRLRKISVVGEALSLAHLGHMRSLIQLKETPNFDIKYIGGLKVLFVFKDSIAAKGFMEDRRRWEEY